MAEVEVLHGVTLTPVIELAPFDFSKQRTSPSGPYIADEWNDYWKSSLEDSEIFDLSPIYLGSWHVPTAGISLSSLGRILQVEFEESGGIASLGETDEASPLTGGVELTSKSDPELCVTPNCCSDLGDISNWKEAASYQEEEWLMLWIGHPWLSATFRQPLLILSDLHESNDPVERWSVSPDELMRAVTKAESELIRFSTDIESILIDQGYQGDPTRMAVKLVGLDSA